MMKRLRITALTGAVSLALTIPAFAHAHCGTGVPICHEQHDCGETCSYIDADENGICDHYEEFCERRDTREARQAENRAASEGRRRNSGHHGGRHCR